MKRPWRIENADTIETWIGHGRFRGNLFCIEDALGPKVIFGDGVRITREGEQPDQRTDKPKPAQPTAQDIATAVAGKFGEELGKHLKPETPGNPNVRP